MTIQRPIQQIITAGSRSEGGGFLVRGPFPGRGIDQVDPFLLLDEVGPVVYGPGQAIGAPPHPHRGFETVTYVLDGEIEHRDSMGNRGVLRSGDVQWMTAGSGVLHSELPTEAFLADGGRAHAFQLWINLPAAKKMTAPRYQDIPAARIPTAQTDDGRATLRVLAGTARGLSSPVETHTPLTIQHWTLQSGATVDIEVPTDHNAWLYVFQGGLQTDGRTITDGQLVLYGRGDRVRLDGAQRHGRTEVLFATGAPINEPVARMGPFVMNTRQELGQAFRDFRASRNVGTALR